MKKLRIILADSALRYALIRHRVMAGVEHKAALSRPLKTVVDIGANRGQFALAARAFKNCKVISFEPLPDVAAIFRKVFTADSAVKLHIAAIGEKAGTKLMHLSARDDSSSLLEIGEGQVDVFPGTQEVGTLEVRVGTLDEFLARDEIIQPALLKLDVQGFELHALAGCKSLIDNFDYIYCECSFVELYKDQKLAGDIIDYLRNLGYSLDGVFNPLCGRDDNCIQADLLFRRAGN